MYCENYLFTSKENVPYSHIRNIPIFDGSIIQLSKAIALRV